MNRAWIILLRSGAMFLAVLALTRILGKRQPVRMNLNNFLNYLIIGIIAALTTVGLVASLSLGLLVLGGWVLLTVGFDYLAIKSKWVHDFLNGKATVLVKQGKIMEGNLFRVRLTGEELLQKLRSKNAFNLSEVEFAVMETDGDLNVLLKSNRRPITPQDLNQPVAPETEPQTVILDGNIRDEPLAEMGLNRAWLEMQLAKAGVPPTNVFIGQVDSAGELYLDLFDDAVELPRPRVKEALYANLEKCRADLTTFALETQNPEAKTMYRQNAAKLQQLSEKLEPYLLR